MTELTFYNKMAANIAAPGAEIILALSTAD